MESGTPFRAPVIDQFFVDATQLRRGVSIMRQRARFFAASSTQKIIRRIGGRFMAGDEFRAVRRRERDDLFVAFVVGMKNALRLKRLRVEAIEEGSIALGDAPWPVRKILASSSIIAGCPFASMRMSGWPGFL